ncbi:MAG: hypothetical protein HY822_16290 [Acidobacteria bacterium]|nr:hypothetical protein [Acidobacteriota bacterium]
MRFSIFWIGLAAAVSAAAQQVAPDCALVAGWQQQGPVRSFEADNLFEYMDGNAEGYLIYQFQRMKGVSCRQGEVTLIFDISEMADPDSAYGMFAANRDQRQPSEALGMGGQIVPRKAIFAKDKYYVEIAANPAGDHTATLRAFSQAIGKRIQGRTSLPEAISWFPTEKLVRDSIRMVPESLLGLRLLKRGWVAQYESGKAFIMREASPEVAAQTMEKFKARIAQSGQVQAVKIADEGFQATDKYLGRLSVFRKGRYLGGYAGLAEGQDGPALAAALAAKVQ